MGVSRDRAKTFGNTFMGITWGQKIRSSKDTPFWNGGRGRPHRNTSLGHVLPCWLWFRSNGENILCTGIHRENWSIRVLPFTVIDVIDTDPHLSAIYDFLSVVHGPIS